MELRGPVRRITSALGAMQLVGLDPTIHEHRSTQVFMDPPVKPSVTEESGEAGEAGEAIYSRCPHRAAASSALRGPACLARIVPSAPTR